MPFPRYLQLVIAAATLALLPGFVSAAPRDAQSLAVYVSQEHRVTGVILAVSGSTLTLRLRDGRQMKIDISAAQKAQETGVLPINHPVMVFGARGRDGIFYATSIGHVIRTPNAWAPDNF